MSGRDPERSGTAAYRATGIDLDAAAASVDLIREVALAASRPEVVSSVGGFAGLVDLGDGRLLAASADGVGTKLEIARRLGVLDTVGIDLVAMCANDVVCTGAEPLFFLDYLAVGRLDPTAVAAIVSGVAEGCRRAGCALLGGETAEHPGVMPTDGFDLAGFCVGLVDRQRVLMRENAREGDALIGFRSTGLHANGFSLVRRVLLEDGRSLDAFVPELGRSLGEELLEPTALYVRAVLELHRAGLVRSAAHITGGGFQENVGRALPENLGAVIDRSAWTPQPIFALVARAAGLDPSDLFAVLNQGIGMVAVIRPGSENEAVERARAAGTEAVIIGHVTREPRIEIS
ncbi:MAG: phosphoribosylformylglycinamidine cyclo-ligase [Actinobacteria bacterium]|nr:phosphoribosylformylglycinamidine cyclo-ligase [Actinomycetota bacterium]